MLAWSFAVMLSVLLALLSCCGVVQAGHDAPADPRINANHEPDPYEIIHARFMNSLTDKDLRLCWLGNSDAPEVCFNVDAQQSIEINTSMHHEWSIAEKIGKKYAVTGTFQVVGGQFIYDLKSYIDAFEFYEGDNNDPFDEKEMDIVRVRRPSVCERGGGFDCQGPAVSDAIRRATYRLKHAALCFCGDYNYSTTFTLALPNHEMPLVLSGDRCGCDSGESGMANVFDLYMGCNWDTRDPPNLDAVIDCDALSDYKFQEETRLFLLHATTHIDKLSMKHKIYAAMYNVYGQDIVELVMPVNFNFIDNPSGIQKFLRFCDQLIAEGKAEKQFIILKDVLQHRQHGIDLTSAAKFKKDFEKGRVDIGNSVANMFLANPYMINGYKLNMRRYMLLVCTGGRLRGYVHDDGKNIFTKLPYREPWEGEFWGEDKAKLRRRLDELITTGYVPANHFDDNNLPLTGLEFAQYVKEISNGTISTDYLVTSMWARLALAIHAGRTDGDSDLCDVRSHTLRTSVPSCMHGAVRFQHFGCDFHIDAALTGYESRLFECNKGPDWSAHAFRDGQLKRDVAADIFSFVGFKGRFDGSVENARAHRLNLIYDSEYFDEVSLAVLVDRLRTPDPRASASARVQPQGEDQDEEMEVDVTGDMSSSLRSAHNLYSADDALFILQRTDPPKKHPQVKLKTRVASGMQ
jgi:hypothetical protein